MKPLPANPESSVSEQSGQAAEFAKQLAAELGFALSGICEAEPSSYRESLRAWLDAGKHGEMSWLANYFEQRVDPDQLLPNARSILVVADRLPEGLDDDQIPEHRRGRVARYAQVSDYHKVIKKRLIRLADTLRERWPDEQFKACVDTAPILEREHAMRAGLGWTGKHTLLLNQHTGSHMMLGEIVTTLALHPDPPATDHCGTCSRCIDACPTDCITPYSLDARHCISYLTIEHRSEIDPKFHEAIGDWIYGCDICQDVCPYVRKAAREQPVDPDQITEAGYETRFAALDIAEVLNWSERDRQQAFIKSAMKRAKLDQMKRNALIVAGNRLADQPDSDLLSIIQRIAEDTEESEMVRSTAKAISIRT